MPGKQEEREILSEPPGQRVGKETLWNGTPLILYGYARSKIDQRSSCPYDSASSTRRSPVMAVVSNIRARKVYERNSR